MLRYRRYRVFLVFAAAVIFAIWQFGQGSEWDAQSSTEYLRQQLGLRAGSSETAINEGLAQKKEESANLPMQFDNKDAADLPPNTGNIPRPPTDNLPADVAPKKQPVDMEADAVKPNPGASLPDKSKELEKEAEQKEQKAPQRQRLQPGATDPFTDDLGPSEVGQGRKEVDVDAIGDSLDLHFSKSGQHFPITSTIALPSGTPKALPKVQHVFPAGDKDARADEDKLAAIKAAFQHAWKGYKDNAFGRDELRPVSGSARNPFNGWGATLIDSLDSLWMLGLKDEFADAVKTVGRVDFTTSPRADIPVFETTIRYLGGLLSAYDVSEGKYSVLLKKATELGDILYAAFDTPNRMPMLFFQWRPAFASQIHRASSTSVLSELGSLSMEFTRLAQLTKDDKYYDAIARITNAFHEWQNHTRTPGLWPVHVDASGCERIRESTPTRQKDGDSVLTKLSSDKIALDTKEGAKMIPVEQPEPFKFAVEGAGKPSGKSSPDGFGIPAQVENSRLKDPNAAGNAKPETPEGFVPLKEPEPFVFKSGPQAGKVGQIQRIDVAAGATHGDAKEGVDTDTRQATDAAAALDRDGSSSSSNTPKRGGKVGSIEYIDVGADGKERPRTDNKNTNRDTTGSVEDSMDPMDAAVAGMYARSSGDNEKRSLVKRQVLSHKEDEGPMGTIPVAPADAAGSPTGSRAKLEDPACRERGLASVSKYGREEFSLGSMSDSMYEYLLKEYVLLGGLNEQYRDMYSSAIEAATEWILFRPMLPREQDVLLAGNHHVHATNEDHAFEVLATFAPVSSHLVCFAGGMYGLGAKIFDRPQDLEIAKKLTNGCIWAYESTGTGIMPESFEVLACDSLTTCPWNETQYDRALDPAETARFARYDQDLAKWEKDDKQEKLELAAAAGDTDAKVQMEQDRRHQEFASKKNWKEEKIEPPPIVGDTTAGKIVKRQNIAPAKVQAKDDFAEIADKVDLGASASKSGASAGDTSKVTKWRPEQPKNHAEYVKNRVQSERLPGGMVNVIDRRYVLRPEAIESVFYMHRLTGEPHWREKGWSMFQAIEKYTRTEFGHSTIDDVTSSDPEKQDEQESFWLAETLKYFYLLFDDAESYSLDEWVFNTEAHPFRRPGIKGGWKAS